MTKYKFKRTYACPGCGKVHRLTLDGDNNLKGFNPRCDCLGKHRLYRATVNGVQHCNSKYKAKVIA